MFPRSMDDSPRPVQKCLQAILPVYHSVTGFDFDIRASEFVAIRYVLEEAFAIRSAISRLSTIRAIPDYFI
jgi:hypothetical protein